MIGRMAWPLVDRLFQHVDAGLEFIETRIPWALPSGVLAVGMLAFAPALFLCVELSTRNVMLKLAVGLWLASLPEGLLHDLACRLHGQPWQEGARGPAMATYLLLTLGSLGGFYLAVYAWDDLVPAREVAWGAAVWIVVASWTHWENRSSRPSVLFKG